jgi:mRNA-degrading endonuclease RelE of RelBE toxin-antitoxin system
VGYIEGVFTVVETPTFMRRAEKLLSDDERKELIDFLAANPLAGDVIPETGGVRKVRYGGRGKGKRGGYRVIYYVFDEGTPLYALLIYGKDEQDNLTPDQRKAARTFTAAIKAARKKL